MDQKLYDFLVKYNLRQADLDEAQALEAIRNTMEASNEDETVISGFIAEVESSNGLNEPQAILITDTNRIIFNPKASYPIPFINLSDIERVDIGEKDNSVIIKTPEAELVVNALDNEGAEALVDTLYSVLSNIVDEDRLDQIFEVPEEELYEEDEEIPALTEVTEQQENNIPEITTPEAELVNDDTMMHTTPVDKIDSTSQESTTTQAVAKEKTPFDFKKLLNNKPLLYVLIGVGVILVAFILYFVISLFSSNQAVKHQAEELVGIYNEIDDVYFQARDLEARGAGGSTPEEWEALENQSSNIQDELNNIDFTDETNNLYQALYFYNESLNTALYYGRQFASTGNQLQGNTLSARLDSAYQSRLSALNFIENDFPDLLDRITNETDLSEADVNYPNKDYIDEKINEANSLPTDNIVDIQNSKGSDE